MGNGQAIVAEYLAGRCAARDGKAPPPDASPHYLDGYRVKSHDMAISHAGWDYKCGHISYDVLADVVKSKRRYP